MTISTDYAPISYTGNGSTVNFTVSWPFNAAADLVVALLDTSTGTYVSGVLLAGTGTYGYQVAGTADANTGVYPNGTITFNTAPLASHLLTIKRSTPHRQSLVLTNNGPMPAKQVEAGLDRLTLQLQETNQTTTIAMTLPSSAVGVSSVLPQPVATYLLGWSADALSIVNYSPNALGMLTTYSTAVVQNFSGTGSQTAFTLSSAPGALNNTSVHVGGLYLPKSAYTLSGTTLTFNTAPPAGTANIEVAWVMPTQIIAGAPSDGSVTPAKMSTGGPSWDGSGNFTTLGNMTAPAFVPNGAAVPANGMFLPGANTIAWATAGVEALRIAAAGQIGIGGPNYGTLGQVITSNGPAAAPSWQTPSAGGSSSVTGSIVQAPTWTAPTTAASGTGSVATVTFSATFTPPVGSTVTIAGMTPAGYNGTWTVSASAAGSVSFASTTTGAQTVAGTLTLVPGAGYLKCDGSIYTRATYPALAAFIGAPPLPAAEATTYTNAALLSGGIYQANGVLFMTGTATNAGGTALANALYTSPDGGTWTARSAWNLASFLNLDAEAVAYNGTTYCAIPSTSGVMTSADLVTWSRVATILVGTPAEIAYGGSGNTFVLLGGNFACGWTSTTAASSPTGATWTGITLTGVTGTPVGVAAYAGGVVLLTTTKAFYSATGTGTYTDITSSITAPGTFRGISYQNGQFILVCDGGIWTSATGAGASWTQVAQLGAWPLDPTFSKIRWNGAAYVASKDGQTANYYSANLTAWGRTNQVPKGSPLTTMQVTAVQASKFWGRAAGGVVRSFDFNSYTAGTQFPVPALGDVNANLAPAAAPNLPGSPVGQQAWFIKT